MQIAHGTRYPYISMFDEKSGFYLRTGVIQDGKDTGEDPFMADFPELLDIGIMGHCIHGKSGLCQQAGIDCYQDGPHVYQEHMNLEDFQYIIDQCKGRTFQVALGGRGDPDQHPQFKEILKYCRENHIVPNFTTSGLGLTDEIIRLCRLYCGAVAVSWYRSRYTVDAIHHLIRAGIKTNIHYVLSCCTLEEAITLLKTNGFPKGINAVVFLLYKPVGLGRQEYILKDNLPLVKTFFELIDDGNFPYKIGFDSCTVPGLLQYSTKTNLASIDTCEGGRWSAYISSDMKMLPCSFDNQAQRWSVDLRKHTIQEAWDSECFSNFRNCMANACPACTKRMYCMGGCPICPEIVLCSNKEELHEDTK